MKMQVADETLMAFADGELSPGETEAIARQLADDEALAARLEIFRRTRAAVAGLSPAPVPAALEARIRALAAEPAAGASPAGAGPGAEVVWLAPLRRKVPLWQVPAAAAAALLLGIGAAMLAQPRADGGEALAGLLDVLPSGESRVVDGDEITPIATLQNGDGALCREYESLSDGRRMVSVACREADGWDLRLAIATGEAGTDYAPASSLDTLDAWMAANGAEAPMSPEEEARALGALR
jgi:hypothetical protein